MATELEQLSNFTMITDDSVHIADTDHGTDYQERFHIPPDRNASKKENLPDTDFVSLTTIISSLHSKGQLMEFSDDIDNPAEWRLEPLGRGSVFSAFQQEIKYDIPSDLERGAYLTTSRKIVIKKTKPLFNNLGKPRRTQEVQSFIKELRILSHKPLKESPYVISLLGVAWHCEQFYPNPAVQPQLVLEAANGTLEDLLIRANDLPFRTQISLARDITRGLMAVHNCRIIHGDVKPANILVIGSASARIADFSHSWTDTDEPIRTHVGTIGFMAPEMRRGAIIRNAKATDVFSMGVVLWRIFTANEDLPPPSSSYTGELDHRDYQDDLVLVAALNRLLDLLEGTANESRYDALKGMLCASLSESPEKRSLSTVHSEISRLSPEGHIIDHSEEVSPSLSYSYLKNNETVPELDLNEPLFSTQIYINYQAFIHAPGPVHDQMISCLEQISQTPDDPRQAQAFYELGVSSVSRFGNPNEMVPGRALEYFFAAAKHGNMTAKGYFKRLFGALSDEQSTDRHLPMRDYIEPWLLEAAVAGHQTAFEDYTAEGSDSSKKAMVIDLQVSGLFDVQAELPNLDEFRKEAELFSRRKVPPVPYNSTAVHWAAYKDLDEHIRILVSDMEFDINFRNGQGETPLMTACSMGNLKAALALIECGCEVNSINNYGETCLHYIWRFCDEDAKCLLRVLVDSGIDFEIIAPMKRVHYDGKTVNRPTLETSPLPVLHGTAIERVAARGRLVLLDEFLRLGPSINPSNGNIVRRMILWASKLNFPAIRKFLVQYGESRHSNDAWKKAPMNPRLPPIEKSYWENGGLKKDYMCAVAQGWLSNKGQGWSTPESFWRLCCHRQRWKSNLQGTIREILERSNKALCHFEDPLRHALSDRRPEFCLAFLTMYINDHVSYPFPGHESGQHTCENYQNSQKDMCGFDISPVTPKTSLIDRLLFKNDGTLLQRSIIDGDRRMFQVLGDLQASLIRPWSEMKPRVHEKTRYKTIWEMGTRLYLNCYSVLAIHSKDIWFACEFHRRGVSHDHLSPRRSPDLWNQRKKDYPEYWPPLLHALDEGFYLLAAFLLAHGASLEEPIGRGVNVFDRALSPIALSSGTAQFLFKSNGEYFEPSGKKSSIDKNLLPSRLFEEGNGCHILGVLAAKWDQSVTVTTDVFSPFLSSPRLLFPNFQRSLPYPQDILEKLTIYTPIFLFRFFSLILSVQINIIMSSGRNVRPPAGSGRNVPRLRARTLKKLQTLQNSSRPESYSTYHESLLPVLSKVWVEMLSLFPNARITSQFQYGNLCCEQSPLAFSIVGNQGRNLWWQSALCGQVPTCHFASHKSPSDERIKMITGTLDLYERTVDTHKPTLRDLFLWNEYSLLPSNHVLAKRLHRLGFRHSALCFIEIRILGQLVLFAIVLMGCLAVDRGLSNNPDEEGTSHWRLETQWLWLAYLAGGIPLYTSLLLSLFERPYIFERLVVVVLGLGYLMILLKRPHNDIHILLVFFQLITAIPAFLWCWRLHAFSTWDQSLKDVLRGHTTYTGYLPRQYLQGIQSQFSPTESIFPSIHRSMVSIFRSFRSMLRSLRGKARGDNIRHDASIGS